MITALAVVVLVALTLASLSIGIVVRVALEVRRLRALVDVPRRAEPPYLVCRRCCGYGLIRDGDDQPLRPCPDCATNPQAANR